MEFESSPKSTPETNKIDRESNVFEGLPAFSGIVDSGLIKIIANMNAENPEILGDQSIGKKHLVDYVKSLSEDQRQILIERAKKLFSKESKTERPLLTPDELKRWELK